MSPLRFRRQCCASTASRFPLCFQGKQNKKRRQLPAAVPLLLLICLLAFPFYRPPVVVYAQDRVAITRVREYIPSAGDDGTISEYEVYYPQLSFGRNPNQLQIANAMMREYALQRCLLHRQAARLRGPGENPPENVTIDYRVMRNSGGYFSVAFQETEALSLANMPPQGFTIRLADQKVCQLADLFLSNTNYTSLLDQEISRMLQRPFEGISFDTPFYLTDDSIVLLPEGEMNGDGWPGLEPVQVSLSAPAVVRKLAVGLTTGHTRAEPFGGLNKTQESQVPSEDAPGGVQGEESMEID